MYNYKNSKANIINILKSETPIEKMKKIPADVEFTYENGIETYVSSIFIDIKNSSKLFHARDEKLARLLRAFTSEIITILQNNPNYNQIGIRGDCVYGIYSTQIKKDVVEVLDIAITINTFMKMFNELLKQNHYSTIGVGIGLGCDKELIIKAGRSGTGINNKIWIGDAVVDAANLSSIANRNGFKKIAMDTYFYDNIIDIKKKKNDEYAEWITKVDIKNPRNSSGIDFYQCSIINCEFDDWIEGGMKDNV